MVTIRQIAEVSGYSKASVWLALNGHPRLPQETRDKILKVAKEIGYRPNPAYRAMLQQVRAGRPIEYRSTLGLLHGFNFPDPENRVDYHRQIVAGFTERAVEFGYEVENFWINQPNMTGRRLTSILKARGINGIVITPLPEHRKLDLDLNAFATAAIGFTTLNPNLNRVEFNNQDATALCISKLLEHGYQNIGFIQRQEYETWRKYNLSAPYLWMLSELSPKELPKILSVDQHSCKTFLKWFRNGKFDALISNYEGVADWLNEAGVRIPEDIGLVFPTPTQNSHYSHIDQHPKRVGAAAADILMEQVQRGECGSPANPKTLVTDVSWVDGDSIRQIGPPVRSFILRSQ